MPTDLVPLVKALSANDPSQRQSAAEKLAQLGEEARPAAVSLVEACGIDDEAREWVVAALEGLGPPPPTDVARLSALLRQPALDVAYWAATLLGRLGPEAKAAVASLAETLDSHAEQSVRQRAAWALAQIGPAAAGARGALEKAAAGSDGRLASLAKDALTRVQG